MGSWHGSYGDSDHVYRRRECTWLDLKNAFHLMHFELLLLQQLLVIWLLVAFSFHAFLDMWTNSLFRASLCVCGARCCTVLHHAAPCLLVACCSLLVAAGVTETGARRKHKRFCRRNVSHARLLPYSSGRDCF